MNIEKIRDDFPVLKRRIDGKQIIYFDNACSSLKPTKVIDAMNYYYENLNACGGFRSGHDLSKETDEICEKSRNDVKKFINAKTEKEIIWTRNTTEAINLVSNSLNFKPYQNVICTTLDHHSSLLPFYMLYNKKIIKNLKLIKIEKDGYFDINKFSEFMDKSTKIVSLNLASNVTGTLSPAKEICKIAHDNGTLVLADGAQFIPHYKIDVQDIDVDFLVFSIHKICGPSGMGVLYGKYHLLEELNPFIVGGGTIRDVKYNNGKISPVFLPPPKKFEAGIQNYAGIIGSGAALEYVQKIGIKNIENYERKLIVYLLKLFSELDGVELIGSNNPVLRGSLFSFILENRNVSPKDVADFMNTGPEKFKIMIRAGAHCTNPFHHQIGVSPLEGYGSVRASLYFYNTLEEIEIFINHLKKFLSIINKK